MSTLKTFYGTKLKMYSVNQNVLLLNHSLFQPTQYPFHIEVISNPPGPFVVFTITNTRCAESWIFVLFFINID